jgi:NAD(P)-dependent dehydrogenase (short-subunit alcohol dehydrogenase family)
MLIRGVAKESGRFGIRANCVGPGWIAAGLGQKALEGKLSDAGKQQQVKQSIPLGRFGTADEVACAVVFLCSREASFISGQSLAVDGGSQV